MSDRNPSSHDASEELPAYLARRIDATAMKAFAHPLRMAMYDYLSDHGSATATMLARHTGESTGQTSYHLRQLQRHGFVAEDVGRGSGRERWWAAVGFSMEGTELAKDSATRPAVETMLRAQVQQRADALGAWYLRSDSEDPAWVRSSTHNKATATLNLAETAALTEALMTLIHEHTEAARARREAEGREGRLQDDERRVRLYLDIFPLARDDAGQ